MFAWLLNVAYLALLAAVSPVILFRIIVRGKYRSGWSQKLLGRVPRRAGNRPCVWFHAVSVGEVLQLQPLVDALLRRDAGLEVVISTTTPTGFDVAQKHFAGRQVFYFPLDFSWAVNAALARIRPAAIVLVELELWPNLVFAAARRAIPVVLVNGRITERSFRGYRRIRPLIAAVLQRIAVLAVQSEIYARRLQSLGANPARVHITGSIKFDRIETARDNPRTRQLRSAFGLGETDTVFIAGSTQDPEERYALDTYRQLQSRYPGLRLILVPRHQERFDDVARLVEHECGLPLLRRSRLSTVASDTFADQHGADPETALPPVILLDTLGELSACWGLASIAFVGGSLTQRGGQNMIEPAGFGAALLFGPNTWNFKDVVELLLGQNAARVVRSGDELTASVCELISHPAAAAELGERARQLALAQRGATARTVELIGQVLPLSSTIDVRAA